MPDDALEEVERRLGPAAGGKRHARRLDRRERPFPGADQKLLAEDETQIARLRQTPAKTALIVDDRAAHEISRMVDELTIDRLGQGAARLVRKHGELLQEGV